MGEKVEKEPDPGIGLEEIRDDQSQTSTELGFIPLDLLVKSEANLRSKSEPDRLYEAVRDDPQGVREPLDVWHNPETKFYEIMDGWHRYLAVTMLYKHSDKDQRWWTIPCYIHHYITNLDQAWTWTRQHHGQGEDVSYGDKCRAARYLVEKYGNLSAGCKAENLPYDKYRHWLHIPEQFWDSPKLDTKVMTGLSGLPNHIIDNLSSYLGYLKRDAALMIIRRLRLGSPSDQEKFLERLKILRELIEKYSLPDSSARMNLEMALFSKLEKLASRDIDRFLIESMGIIRSELPPWDDTIQNINDFCDTFKRDVKKLIPPKPFRPKDFKHHFRTWSYKGRRYIINLISMDDTPSLMPYTEYGKDHEKTKKWVEAMGGHVIKETENKLEFEYDYLEEKAQMYKERREKENR